MDMQSAVFIGSNVKSQEVVDMSLKLGQVPAAALVALLTFVLPGPALSEAVSIFREIVGESDPGKLLSWGLKYREGDGVARNIDRAIRLYCKAARDGHAEARFQLGLIYAKGEGVAPDRDLATAWFRLAAEQSHPRAAEMLVMMDPKRKYARAACILSDGSDLYPPPPARMVRCKSSPGCRQSRLGGNGLVQIGSHPAQGQVASLVRKLAPSYRVSPDLVLAVIEAESGFNPQAMSPKNAQGLMQLIPATAERFGVADVWDPEQNIRGGMAYLRWLMGRFEGDVELVLAGYNAGEGAVERHGGVPPYAETEAYVSRILARLGN